MIYSILPYCFKNMKSLLVYIFFSLSTCLCQQRDCDFTFWKPCAVSGVPPSHLDDWKVLLAQDIFLIFFFRSSWIAYSVQRLRETVWVPPWLVWFHSESWWSYSYWKICLCLVKYSNLKSIVIIFLTFWIVSDIKY